MFTSEQRADGSLINQCDLTNPRSRQWNRREEGELNHGWFYIYYEVLHDPLAVTDQRMKPNRGD